MNSKLFSDANHFTLVATRHAYEPNQECFFKLDFHGELRDAAKILADVVLAELGDGDGENGGYGDLKNCYGSIIDSFVRTGHYEYADCRFNAHPILHVDDFMN